MKIGTVENCVPSIRPTNSSSAWAVRLPTRRTDGTVLGIARQESELLPDFQDANRAVDLQKIANKEVEWDFSDAEEAAIYDMRLGMEKSFMFGVKNTIFDPRKKENVMLTGGIWWQPVTTTPMTRRKR